MRKLKREILYSESGAGGPGTAAQRSCVCPIPGSAQDQVGWGPEQPELVGDSPVHIKEVGEL